MLAVIGFAFIIMFFVAALISFVMTLIALWAWQEERELFGEKITPHEARTFVTCGIVGAVICGVSGAIADANSTGENIASWFAIGGYTLGSLGYASLLGMQYEREEKERALQAEERRYAQMQKSPPVRVVREPTQPFEYASWNDEEPRA